MRLTLRTLLAYLDDILEEQDIQVLKTKIEESPRATQLIEQIRESVDNDAIGALSPDAIGPLENANAMGEYLDSTLSPEQIAELERLCLDSDMSLAEASACHQILTVVLGQPAQVPDHLRQRIYDLPLSDALHAMEQQTQPAADARAAGKAARGETPNPNAKQEAGRTPSGEATRSGGEIKSAASGPSDGALAAAATQIRPVGPDDSGVSHAAVRMRSDNDDLDGRSEAEIVASTTRAMQANTNGYGGSIRPSRVTPWLVTLAMTGVVAYVLMQIFSPLAKRRVREVGVVAVQDIDNGAAPILEPNEPTVPVKTNESGSVADPNSPAQTSSLETDSPNPDTPKSPPPQKRPTENASMTPSEVPASEAAVPVEPVAPAPAGSTTPASPETSASTETSPATGSPRMTEPGPVQPGPDKTALNQPGAEKPLPTVVEVAAETPGGAATPSSEAMTATDPKTAAETSPLEPAVTTGDLASGNAKRAEMPDPPTEPESPKPQSSAIVAQLNNETALILAETPQGWSRLVSPDTETKANPFISNSVRSGQTVIAPALYRPILANQEGLEWTLAGPTRLKITQDPSGATVTNVIDGRLLLASSQPDVTTTLQLGPRNVQVVLPQAQTVLAIEMLHFRPAGVDPLVPENRRPIYRVIVVQGEAALRSELVSASKPPVTEPAVTITTGQQWQARGVQDAAVTTVSLLPTWIDDAAQKNLAIASARDGLMEFVTKVEPLEKALREAMAFRRVEVAALAAETLLLLGRADVYFGSDGILSRPRQRLFWTEHFQLLRQHIASDAQAAADVKSAIALAELADSDNLFKLLIGFTNEELAAGGDERLVKLLDSASMPVRVLAIENLKAIVGDDLGYRADQENANTRRADIKKWEARLRKGDIRYAN